MTKEYFLEWLKATGIRTIKTMGETALGMIGTAVIFSQVAWVEVLLASLLAGIITILTCLPGLPEVPKKD